MALHLNTTPASLPAAVIRPVAVLVLTVSLRWGSEFGGTINAGESREMITSDVGFGGVT